MELRCVCKYLLKHLMVRRFLRKNGREFQTDVPENAKRLRDFGLSSVGRDGSERMSFAPRR